MTENILIEKILNAVCEEYEVSREQLQAKGRSTQKIAIARQVACYVCRKMCEISRSDIVRKIGCRDKTIVTKNIKLTIKVMCVDKELCEQIQRIIDKVNG